MARDLAAVSVDGDAAGVPVEISSGDLSAAVLPMGAELAWLRDAAGRDLLWDGDPAFWSGRAPLLFPIVGALADGCYRFDGETHALPQHGFARRSAFALTGRSASEATFRLVDDARTRSVYPFAFELSATYRLDGPRLSVEVTVANHDRRPMPAALGFHPAFRWPLPGGPVEREAYSLTFAEDEPEPVRRPVEGGLLGPEQASPVQGRRLALADGLFTDGALVFERAASRSLIYGAAHGPSLRIDWPGMPSLGIWTKPGAGFVCVEPWQGYADHQGYAGTLADKPGMIILPPGTERRFGFSVTLQP